MSEPRLPRLFSAERILRAAAALVIVAALAADARDLRPALSLLGLAALIGWWGIARWRRQHRPQHRTRSRRP